ncbi:MAG: hypothetical protein U9R53_10550 [Chloroflexota bacterium]|nr:hypothetical protein [Chloroflexota bacterium]
MERWNYILHMKVMALSSYTPDPGYFGEDSFEYYMLGIPERQEFTDWATVYITVNP